MAKLYSKLLNQSDVSKFAKSANIGERKLDGEGLYLQRNLYSTVFVLRTKVKRASGIRHSWFTLGNAEFMTLSEARKKAHDCRQLMHDDIDPKTYSDQNKLLGKTFGQILELYTKDRKSRLTKTSRIKFDSVLSNLSSWNTMVMEKITEHDINGIIKKLKEKSPSTAAYLLREIKLIYEFAYENDFILVKPKIKTKAEYKVKARTRFLSERSIGVLFSHLWTDNDVPFQIKVAIYGLFILLLRRNELLSLEWNDIDFRTNRIIVKHTKKIDNFNITAPIQLINRLKELKDLKLSSKYVFVGKKGRYTGATLCNYCKEVGKKYGIGEFTPHDARRTGRTNLSARGYDAEVLEMALAHIPSGVKKHYLHTNLSSLRAKLLQDYANIIDEIAK